MILALLLGCVDSCKPVDPDDPYGGTYEPPVEEEVLMPIEKYVSDEDNAILNCLQGHKGPDCYQKCPDGTEKHITEECVSPEPSVPNTGRFGPAPWPAQPLE